MRSDIIKQGLERAPHRSLLRATGAIESEADWDKPFILAGDFRKRPARCGISTWLGKMD